MRTATRELALQEYLRAYHPTLPLEAADVLVLRALHAERRSPGRRLPAAVSQRTGIDRDTVHAQLEKLAAEGWAMRLHGYALTSRARALGTLLWTCTVCGCTDEHACRSGCFWIRDERCSRCLVPDTTTAAAATASALAPPIRYEPMGLRR